MVDVVPEEALHEQEFEHIGSSDLLHTVEQGCTASNEILITLDGLY